MIKILFIIIFIFVSNCKLNKSIDNHGVIFLEKKQGKLTLSKTNKNDILKILGPPSTKSTFDNDVWIYLERRNARSSIFKLGKKKLITNNVLVLEIDNKGLLAKKDFYDIDDMKNIQFSEDKTVATYSKKSFVYEFLSSMRQKINDPLGKRKK
jgi:outer membrane protein assembly factor BamE (lipoprotein component of BamABCDE complex)